MSHLKYFSYPGFGEYARETLSYNQAVRIGNRIEISGQGGWDPATQKVHADISSEIQQAFANVELALKDAGGKGWSEVYKVRIYVLENTSEIIKSLVDNLRAWMPNHKPLLTCIMVKDLALDGMRIEIEAYADLAGRLSLSNGIRFSVSDLSPPLSRILPTIHAYRLGVSLYDCQFDPETGAQVPIPDHIIDNVVAALIRFKIVCADLGVQERNIQVVATEATREAINSAEFIQAILSTTSLNVQLLKKEDEGRIGALGVASGFSEIEGLMMDLGGGSTQITWMISQNGNVRTSPQGSFSFPYGAAALTRMIFNLKKGKSKHEADIALEKLRKEMVSNFRDAYHKLQIPGNLQERAKHEGGFTIYLSGGGFRGWGYLLLYVDQLHEHHYPISLINGYAVGKDRFGSTEALEEVARTAHLIFRVSDRRREQVPAVAFLVHALTKAIPYGIKEARFCQGGVREGILFRELLPSVRAQDPLEIATQRFATASVNDLQTLLHSSIPKSSRNSSMSFPTVISDHVINAFANTLYVHTMMEKESASTAALYSTSVGIMSSSRGISHADRARLALMLESRYMGELPPREVEFRESLRRIITSEEVWWAAYIGRVGYLIGRLYPAGLIDERKPRIVLSAEWSRNLGKKSNKRGILLTISIQKMENDPAKLGEALRHNVGIVEKIGKKQNWIGGKDGWGLKVRVDVVEEDIL
ncbi:Ppx/GppA phosphatase family-domain-containing protein [Aspergillus granulosus]|uniref:Ppx/GppA phosphatase family-domain-containing protein n=1 Tax=Aspergillus granulosus TaxID=176169 RepID=A0ABR4GXT4_9EURO